MFLNPSLTFYFKMFNLPKALRNGCKIRFQITKLYSPVTISLQGYAVTLTFKKATHHAISIW